MDYITWKELALVVGFILIVVLCLYIIRLARNLNECVKVLKNTLQENKDNVNKTLKELPAISENLFEISEMAKSQLKLMESAVVSINETAEMTAATAQTVKTDIIDRARSIIELIDLIRKLLFKSSESNSEKSGN